MNEHDALREAERILKQASAYTSLDEPWELMRVMGALLIHAGQFMQATAEIGHADAEARAIIEDPETQRQILDWLDEQDAA